MNDYIFLLDECPKGLISLQISADENAIFTFFSANIVSIIHWATRSGLTLGNDIEIHVNFEKECIDVVIPLAFFKNEF